MPFLIVPFDGADELERVVMDDATPMEEVKAKARDLLLHPDADVVIVSNGMGDELWRYPEGYDAQGS